MSSRTIHPLLAAVCVAGLLAGTGCQSSGEKVPRSTAMASVNIHGQSTEVIRSTTQAVLRENLYEVFATSPHNLVAEKPGSRMKQIAYGGWFEGEVWIRVKVNITQFGEGVHLLECNAYAVRDHGDSLFEDESKILRINRKPYRKMLEEVKDRLEETGNR